MEDTYDIHDDLYCPKCRHSSLHSRSCTNIFCEDGYIEDFLDDLEIPGTGYKVLQKQFRKLNEEEFWEDENQFDYEADQ